MTRPFVPLGAAVLYLFALALPSAGEAQECAGAWQETALEAVDGSTTDTRLRVDAVGNAYIANIVDSRLEVSIVSPATARHVAIAGNGQRGKPSIDVGADGVAFLLFTQLDPERPEFGRELYLAHNAGGSFGEPERVTHNRVDDFAPRLVLARSRSPHAVWLQRIGTSSRIVHWTLERGEEITVADDARSPALTVDSEGVAHVAYVMENDVFYANDRAGEFTAPTQVTRSPFVPEAALSIGVTPNGDVLTLYESNNSLYLSARVPGEPFEPQRLLATDRVLDPAMRIGSDGRVLIAYSSRGDLYTITGQGASLNPPERVLETEVIESAPSLDIDLLGNLHVSFLRDGAAYYANNACAPTASFTAAPTSGRVPLTVQFTDLSSGGVVRRFWDFGDGGQSELPNPTHTYQDSGEYTVKLTVWGPGGVQDSTEFENLIAVQDPLNAMRIPDQLVLPGAQGVWFPVVVTHVEELAGFQIFGLYDPNFLHLTGSEFRMTSIATSKIEPEFFILNDLDTSFEVGCLFEIEPPIEETMLPPGEEQRLLNLIFDVDVDAPQGETTEIRLVNDARVSKVRNVFVVNGGIRLPALKSSKVTIRLVEPPFPRRFVRGDFTNDGGVNLGDAIGILAYLFQNGDPPLCFDAADVHDSGRIDISGAVALLNFLFSGGRPPSVPFPNPGLDATDDRFGECLSI